MSLATAKEISADAAVRRKAKSILFCHEKPDFFLQAFASSPFQIPSTGLLQRGYIHTIYEAFHPLCLIELLSHCNTASQQQATSDKRNGTHFTAIYGNHGYARMQTSTETRHTFVFFVFINTEPFQTTTL